MQTLIGISIGFTAAITVENAKELQVFLEQSIKARELNKTTPVDMLKLTPVLEAEVRASFHDNLRITVYDVEAEREADDKSEIVKLVVRDNCYPSIYIH